MRKESLPTQRHNDEVYRHLRRPAQVPIAVPLSLLRVRVDEAVKVWFVQQQTHSKNLSICLSLFNGIVLTPFIFAMNSITLLASS